MDITAIKRILSENGYKIILDKPYGKYGQRIKVEQGSAVICYYNAERVCGKGKLAKPLEKLLYSRENEWKYNDKVFLVYGHDLNAKEEMEGILKNWGLIPLAIDNLPTEGRTIIEQLEHYIPKANYGVVLATPDDVGYDKERNERHFRARQNVIMEMGMLFAKLGRKRVAILIKSGIDFEKPSDIDGLLYLSYTESVSEISSRIKRELKNCGYKITNE